MISSLPKKRMWPLGIPYIFLNVGFERFSFYGIQFILVIYMTKYIHSINGAQDLIDKPEARMYVHFFLMTVYFFSILGGFVSDGLLGKYKTIILFSIINFLGILFLVFDKTKWGLAISLTLIALGGGIIKPCIPANMGDQFNKDNKYLFNKAFSWLYFLGNLGAFFAASFTPWLLYKFGSTWVFVVPAISMIFAIFIFWKGGSTYRQISPPGLMKIFYLLKSELRGTTFRTFSIFIFFIFFFTLYHQLSTTWVLQTDKMDRTLFCFEILPSQIQAFNPLLIMILSPFFAYLVYPKISKYFRVNPVGKVTFGFFLITASFILGGGIEEMIIQGFRPNIFWQLINILIITTAEILVVIPGFEIAYVGTSEKLKSIVTAVFFLSVALGNLITLVINYLINNFEPVEAFLAGPKYYWFFATLMMIVSIIFRVYKNYFYAILDLQDDNSKTV
jgi:POT family proton-dependent oligopeptide transporter